METPSSYSWSNSPLMPIIESIQVRDMSKIEMKVYGEFKNEDSLFPIQLFCIYIVYHRFRVKYSFSCSAACFIQYIFLSNWIKNSNIFTLIYTQNNIANI